jgi:acyl dehydratase
VRDIANRTFDEIVVGATDFRYDGVCCVGDTITTTVTAKARRNEGHRIDFECRCRNQNGDVLADGIATVARARTTCARGSHRRQC